MAKKPPVEALRVSKKATVSATVVPAQSHIVGADAQAMMMFEANKKSTGVAFLLLLFLGVLGGHRFYFGQIGTAILMLLLTITGFGAIITAIWCLIDAFGIPGKVRDYNTRLADAIGRGGMVVIPKK